MSFSRATSALIRADSLIAMIWFNVAAKRAALLALAVLAAIFALAMLNAGGFIGLAPLIGQLWAVIAVAGADIAISLCLLMLMTRVRPGRDLDLALELHAGAVEQLAGAAGSPLSQFTTIVRNPLDSAGRGFLVQLGIMLIKMLWPKKAPAAR
jgi:hypothetical protein